MNVRTAAPAAGWRIYRFGHPEVTGRCGQAGVRHGSEPERVGEPRFADPIHFRTPRRRSGCVPAEPYPATRDIFYRGVPGRGNYPTGAPTGDQDLTQETAFPVLIPPLLSAFIRVHLRFQPVLSLFICVYLWFPFAPLR